MTIYRQILMDKEAPKTIYKLQSYGPLPVAGKAKVNKITLDFKLSPEYRALILVMAMIETNHLAIEERDESKDACKDGSANASIFNINEDMTRKLGFTGSFRTLNDENQLGTVIGLIVKAIDIWTLYPALDFVRGGWSAFRDHKKYHAAEYRNGVATGLSVIDGMPALMVDDRRIEMPISHQGPKQGPGKRP